MQLLLTSDLTISQLMPQSFGPERQSNSGTGRGLGS